MFENFAGKIQMLGVEEYPTEFTGIRFSDRNHLELYVKADSPGNFLGEVNKMTNPGITLTVHHVPNSHADMHDTMNRIRAFKPSLLTQGIAVKGFGAEITSGTVAISLTDPSPGDLEAIANSMGADSVSPESYASIAARILHAKFGTAISVVYAPKLRTEIW